MKYKVAGVLSLLSVFMFVFAAQVFAEPTKYEVSKFEFEGVTNTEKVIVKYNDDAYIMTYDTPNKTYSYLVSDITCLRDVGYESVTFTATDPLMGNETFILITKSDNFTDIRIGSKILKFKVVRNYNLETN